jgi:hypothetical protein
MEDFVHWRPLEERAVIDNEQKRKFFPFGGKLCESSFKLVERNVR